MLRPLLGVVIASVVLYMWGFLVWGVLPWQDWVLQDTPDSTTARAALKENFPANGTYFLPKGIEHTEALEAEFSEGPVAMVHMIKVDGRPMMDSSIMLGGFLLNVVVIGLIAAILGITAKQKYFERVQLCGAMGLAAALLINYGEVAWWQISRAWVLYNGAYNFSFFLIAGIILGAFIKPKAAE